MVGHTLLSRFADFSYVGAAATAELPDPAERNAFFESVGALPAITSRTAAELNEMGPEKALARLRDEVEGS